MVEQNAAKSDTTTAKMNLDDEFAKMMSMASKEQIDDIMKACQIVEVQAQ